MALADDKVMLRSLGRALMEYICCPYKQEEFGHKDTHRDDTMRKMKAETGVMH